MTSTWSFGADSPMKFEIPDSLAELYNQAATEYFKAQERFKRKHNRAWDPINEPIQIKWSRKQRKAWNAFANVFNEVNNAKGPFHENDLIEDFLVKNVAEVAAAAIATPQRFISVAAGLGALFVLLRGMREGV